MESSYIYNPFNGAMKQISGESSDLGGSATGITKSKLVSYFGVLIERKIHIPNKVDESWSIEMFYTKDRLDRITFRKGIILPDFTFSMVLVELKENHDDLNDYESYSMCVSLEVTHPNGRILNYVQNFEIEGSIPTLFKSKEQLNGLTIFRNGNFFQIGSEFYSPYFQLGNFCPYDDSLLMLTEKSAILSPHVKGVYPVYGTTVTVDYLRLAEKIKKIFLNISLNLKGPNANEKVKKFGIVDFNSYFSGILEIIPSSIKPE